LQSSIWQLIANFAPATWLNCDLTTFAQERMCDAEQQLCKRRQDDQSSSRSRSSPGVQLSVATNLPGDRLALSLSKPPSQQPSHINPPICSAGASLG
jgi:hypothetical protein